MKLSVRTANDEDAPEIAALRNAVAEHLTKQYGHGHWSSCVKEQNVMRALRTSHVLVAQSDKDIVGTLRLETKKPWAIDLDYFTVVGRSLYLHDLAVFPERQGQGIGKCLLEEAKQIARGWPSDAIRLDAYDAAAGAGSFYARCGFAEVGRKTYRGVPLIYYELIL
jgi:GNAT superfamily N-acetyltransferase